MTGLMAAKRCTVVCQDRHPRARAAEIDCALGAWPRSRTLPDNTPPSGLPRADLCRGGRPVESVLAVLSSLTASTAGSYRAPHRGVTRAEMRFRTGADRKLSGNSRSAAHLRSCSSASPKQTTVSGQWVACHRDCASAHTSPPLPGRNMKSPGRTSGPGLRREVVVRTGPRRTIHGTTSKECDKCRDKCRNEEESAGVTVRTTPAASTTSQMQTWLPRLPQ